MRTYEVLPWINYAVHIFFKRLPRWTSVLRGLIKKWKEVDASKSEIIIRKLVIKGFKQSFVM